MLTDVIYSDNLIEANWFQMLDTRLREVVIKRIGPRGSNPKSVEVLISYDRPDIILFSKGKAKLVLEKTREVPTGHNVGQRVARLVKAVENKIPVIKFLPYEARKHGRHTSVCNLNVRLLEAFDAMWAIHGSPVVSINWPAEPSGELVNSGEENNVLKVQLSRYIDAGFAKPNQVFAEAREAMRSEYSARVANFPSYAEPPPSVRIEQTKRSYLRLEKIIPEAFMETLATREETVIYMIGMNEKKCRRDDPYTGTQFIYDYAYCRSGPKPEDKVRNLILYFPRIRKATWLEKNPNHPMLKSSNWYLTANALVFSDGVICLR